MTLKIILDVQSLYDATLSGVGRYTLELAKRLPAHPLVDEVLYYRDGTLTKKLAYEVKTSDTVIERSVFLKWLFYQFERVWFRVNKLKPKLLRTDINTKEVLSSGMYVFHGPNFTVPIEAKRPVVTIHDLSVFRFQHLHPTSRVEYMQDQVGRSLSSANQAITVSKSVKYEVVDYFSVSEQKLTAIHNGIDGRYQVRRAAQAQRVLDKYDLTHKSYLLTVSKIEPRKNHEVLLAAFMQLPKQIRQRFPLVIVGDVGWQAEEIMRQILKLVEQGEIHYLRFVTEEDLPFLYSGASSFLFLSQYEGFGLPILEAMASGVPVICSLDPALQEVGGQSVIAVDTHQTDSVVNAISSVLADEQLSAELTANGLQRAAEFSWDKMTDETVAVYLKASP